ncbi:acetyl-CoA synthetase-like protein [Rhizophagus irregularis]|uniref:Acetyl-CoA synthetase-like protein n=1 Tax=Rhizophagus irregularis TaxID=588596 RepID=A0A2N1NFG4_9GLOM|nr:acetyl-CoA synthetase-like protein [Rhizophagus irregularis]
MIFRSNFPDVDIEKIGIYQFITSNPYGIDDDKVIFIDGITDKKLTFGQLKTNSKKLAFGLKKKVGFKHGDVLAICSHNHIDYPVVIFGAIATGGIVTTVNPDYEYEEFASQLKDCGNFFIVDRFNELIKYKKYRIIPTELESILLTHSSINDSAVIGIYSDEQETEYPLAYVELKPDKIQSDQLKEEIKDFVSQKVDPYKKLHCVHFIDKIPKSSAGKTLRRSLRAKNECVKQCLL